MLSAAPGLPGSGGGAGSKAGVRLGQSFIVRRSYFCLVGWGGCVCMCVWGVSLFYLIRKGAPSPPAAQQAGCSGTQRPHGAGSAGPGTSPPSFPTPLPPALFSSHCNVQITRSGLFFFFFSQNSHVRVARRTKAFIYLFSLRIDKEEPFVHINFTHASRKGDAALLPRGLTQLVWKRHRTAWRLINNCEWLAISIFKL